MSKTPNWMAFIFNQIYPYISRSCLVCDEYVLEIGFGIFLEIGLKIFFWKLDLELERDLAIGMVLPTDRNLEWPWIPLNCHPVFKKIWSYIKISYLSLSITNIFYVIFKIFKLSFNWKMSQSKNLLCQCENLHSETWTKIPSEKYRPMCTNWIRLWSGDEKLEQMMFIMGTVVFETAWNWNWWRKCRGGKEVD